MLPLIFESDEDDNRFLQQHLNLENDFVENADVALIKLPVSKHVESADVDLIEVQIHNHVEGDNEYMEKQSRSCEEQLCTSEDEH